MATATRQVLYGLPADFPDDRLPTKADVLR